MYRKIEQSFVLKNARLQFRSGLVQLVPPDRPWPFLAAVATSIAFIGSIFRPWGITLGAIPVAITMIGWFWPERQLLTFSKVLWYAAYAGTTGAFGLTPLQDQQLGGAIMWVPLGVVFIVVALALMARWISESDRRLKFGSVAALLEKERQRVPAENGVEAL